MRCPDFGKDHACSLMKMSHKDEGALTVLRYWHVDRHFIWSSVCFGYIIYDTIYEAARTLHEKAGNASFLLHHVIGLACCCVGLYLRRMAYFGAVIQVFFEATTPFMHALGCMKTMGLDSSPVYAVTGVLLTPCIVWAETGSYTSDYYMGDLQCLLLGYSPAGSKGPNLGSSPAGYCCVRGGCSVTPPSEDMLACRCVICSNVFHLPCGDRKLLWMGHDAGCAG